MDREVFGKDHCQWERRTKALALDSWFDYSFSQRNVRIGVARRCRCCVIERNKMQIQATVVTNAHDSAFISVQVEALPVSV